MKAVLKETKRIMAVLLSVAMIFAYVPNNIYAAETTSDNDVIEEDAQTDEVADDAADAVEEPSSEPVTEQSDEDERVADEEVYASGTRRVLNVTPTDSSYTTAGHIGNMTYGSALSTEPTFTVAKSQTVDGKDYTFTGINYKWMVPGKKDATTEYTDAEIAAATTVEAKEKMLVEKDLPAGIKADRDDTSSQFVIKVSGTPTEIVDDNWYLVVSDGTAETTEFSKALNEIKMMPVKAVGINPSDADADADKTAWFSSKNSITFYADKAGSQIAKEGYDVEKRSEGSTADVVEAFNLQITPTGISSGNGAAEIKAEIVPFDATATDDKSTVQSTITYNGIKLFDVTPKSKNDVTASLPAVFKITPGAGLTAMASAGTTYKAKLEITSPMFDKITYNLVFKVTSALAIDTEKIKTHDDIAITGNGTYTKPYDLGVFEVGETINDVVIPVKGVAAENITYTLDTESLAGTTQLYPLPDGLSVSTSGSDIKLGGMITTKDSAAYIKRGTSTFAINVKNKNTGAETGKVYFEYDVDDADIEIYMNDGVYDESSAVLVDTGDTFKWYGGSGATLTNEYATVHFVNNSGVDVKLVGSFVTAGAGEYVFDPTSVATSTGITIPAKSGETVGTASFKVVPKTLSGTSINKTLSLKGDAIKTKTIALTYGTVTGLTITKPKEDWLTTADDLGPAYLGEDFSYTFEATYPSSVQGVTWEVEEIGEENDARKTAASDIKAMLDKYGLRLDGATLSAKPLKSAAKEYLVVKIKAISTTSGMVTDSRLVHIDLDTPAGIKLLDSNGKEIKITGGTASYTMPSVKLDELESDKIEFTITNDTTVELEGIKVDDSFTVTGKTPLNVDMGLSSNDQFKVVYDDDDVKDNYLRTEGITLGVGESATFKVVADDAKVKAAGAGTYTVTTNVIGTGIKTTALTLTQKVTDVPVVTYTGGDMTTGVEVNTSTDKYSTTYATNPALQTSVTYALVEGSIPGLTFNKKGYFEGKPSTAGTYKVTVKSTTTTNVSGTLTHEIVVAGDSTLGVKTESGSNDIKEKTYLLPGKIEGYEAKTNELIALVTATTKNASKPTVTIADAKDDRPDDEDLNENKIPDILESSKNPYEGDHAFITATLESTDKDDDNNTILKTGKNYKLTVGTVAGAKEGLHKATVKIAAENATEITFDVTFFVSKKLAISAPAAASAVVNKAVGAKAIPLTAEGGNKDQTIVWSEKGTLVEDDTKYYVTASGSEGTASAKYGFTLNGMGTKKIGDADGVGLVTYVTGTPKLASEANKPYMVGIKAKVSEIAYADNTATASNKLIKTRITDNAKNAKKLMAGTSVAKMIADQAATDVSFPLTVKKNNDPQITDVLYNGVWASDGKMDTEQGYGVVTGDHLANSYSKITKYVFPEQAVNYPANTTLKIGISKGDGANLKVKGKLGKGSASDFRIGTSSPGTATTITETVLSDPEYFYVTLVAGRSAGKYEDTLTFSSDSVEDIVLNLEFTVASASFKATIDNNIDPTDPDAEDRKVYIDKMTEGTGTTNVELDVADGWNSADKTGAAKNLRIINTGNTAMKSVKVQEVVKDGSKWVIPPAVQRDLALAGTISTPTLSPGSDIVATVTNAVSTTKKNTVAYLEVSYKDADDTEHDIYVPVKVVVLNPSVSSITSNPSEKAVSLPVVNEFYGSKEGTKAITLTNTGSGDAETLKNVRASFSGGDEAAFDTPVVPEENKIKAGSNLPITVGPKPNLAAGTYTSTLIITADNLASNIEKSISITVGNNDSFTIDKVTSEGVTINNRAIATRLYNTLVMSGMTTNSNAKTITAKTAGSGSQVVYIDFDGTDATGTAGADVVITFSGTVSTGKLSLVNSVEIARTTTGFNLTDQPKKVVLDTTEKTKGKTDGVADASGEKKVYNDLTFKLYGKVKFAATLFGQQLSDLKAYDENLTSTGTPATTGKDKGKAMTDLSTIIAIGKTLGAAFSGGTLPTAEVAGQKCLYWTLTSPITTKMPADTVITKDFSTGNDVLKPYMYPYTYAGSNGTTTKGEPTGVKWTWTHNGDSHDAVLTLTDTSGQYDTESKLEFTKNSDTTLSTYPKAAKAVQVQKLNNVEATCVTGSGSKLVATAIVDITSTDRRTYTAEYPLATADDALGHSWLDPVVVWTDKNGDGKYTKDEVTVKRTCTVCGETIDLTVVSVTEAISVAPTCSKEGKATYTVTYTDVDKFEKPAGSVTDTKNVKESVIKALGHKYDLKIEWSDDHKTAKKATLVCSQCAESETGHSVDVTGSVTYEIKYNDDGTVASNTAIYKAGTDDEVRSETWVDDIFYNPVVNWTVDYPVSVTKGKAAPELKYTVTYTSANKGTQTTTEPITVGSTTTDDFTEESKATEVTFKAIADLSKYYNDKAGTTKAANVERVRKYFFKDGGKEGISKTYTFKSIKKWNWPKELPVGVSKPSVTATITYTVKEEGKTDTTEDIETAATVSDPVEKGSKVEYTATVTSMDNVTKTDKNSYNKKSGKEQSDDNTTESEPAENDVDNYKTYNLFYSDVEIPVDGLSAALSETGAAASGKWTQFFKAEGDAVTVTGDAKKAVNAGNSLITVTYDGGQFNYQLPVYYQKPALKLTSTSGTILKGKTEATTLHTTVTEKKSNGMFEALEIAAEDVTFAPNNGKAAPESFAPGSNDGEIEIGAKAATAGKINVKKDNWRETIALSYTVKESKNDVITADTKAVTLNTKAETVEAQTVELKLNGEDLSDENKVTVTLPKNWSNAGVEGVAAGDLTDGKLSLTLTGDAIHKKGSYNVNFTTGNKGKFTLKVTISETAVDSAFKLNVKSKMDVTRGQKMVLEPKFNGASGPITGVDIKADGSNFTAEWIEAKNQIVVGVADGKTVAKGKYTETFTITSGGQEYPITLKNFQVNASKPTIKLAKVTLPKSKITGEDGAEGKTNVNATYKQNGKTFSIAPTAVEFMVGNAKASESTEESGWYVVNTKNNVLAQYDEATGTINVKVKNSTGKAGSVKVAFTFAGQDKPMTKSFTVAAK